jgi:RNA polymerase sigma-70 factor (ECF subfamily)
MPEPAADVRTFVRLYETHYTAILAYALRRTDRATAHDVVAETFLVAWRRCADATDGGLPWLYRTAALTLRNRIRAETRAQLLHDRLARQHPTGDTSDFADLVAESDRVRLAMLSVLSDAECELVRLAVWEQLGHRELALVIGSTRGSVAVRLHRARRKLRNALIGSGADEVPIRPAAVEEP